MAGVPVPPRSKLRSSSSSLKDKSPLETLQQMGFSKTRGEKALAATGNHGVQRASEWLLSHVNDPSLDEIEPRDYIVYLCPVGELRDILDGFWDTTYQVCGWNSAHLYQPHITLCSFFKLADSQVGLLDEVMSAVSDELRTWPVIGPLGLDLVTQNNNFIGYFVTAAQHKYLEKLMNVLHEACKKTGLEMKPQMKQLHMTLAFQYEAAHQELLMKLADEINLLSEAAWELCVYSREPTTKGMEVRKILKDYTPAQEDELPLKEAEFVFMEPEEHERSPDGWFKGTDWTTGMSGFFPGNFTVKCSQMEIWTLHRKLKLPFHFPTSSPSLTNSNSDNLVEGQNEMGVCDNACQASGEFYPYAKVNKSKTTLAKQRKLFVIRHGERCDFAFYRKWFEKSFDSAGQYTRINLNCPRKVLPRSSFKNYSKDCPLTEIGKAQAKITGEAMQAEEQTISHVFCSPALRCVETATEFLSGLGSECKISIEPTLFEWLGWYKPNMPSFFSPKELFEFGFPVELNYNPYIKFENIKVYETIEDYYLRSHTFAQFILRKLSGGGNILFVGHSGTTDACTRQLRGKPVRNHEEFRNIVRGVPYCFLCAAQETPDQRKWELVEPPVLPLTHLHNKEYDWKSLLK